jgi:general stress protein YciG
MKKLSHKEISRKGGLKTAETHGPEFYKAIGKKGSDTVLAKYGPDYYKKLTQASIRARVKKYMKKHKVESVNK